MSFTPYYFSSLDRKESGVAVTRRSWEPGLDGGGMDMDLLRKSHAVELDVDSFWPVEHPMEPQDEDRPVKCPMSASSSSMSDGKGHEERVAAESSRKRSEQPAMVKNRIVAMTAAEPPVRAIRKRHHMLTCDNNISAAPLVGKLGPPPIPPSQTLTISQMLKSDQD
ncbi:ZIP metal ion transporter family isoform 1 [Hibiscus syriacus]|uniref:ZIP metal ion transporter family isoform 1 n=1 Tax=Hibiscus syriacus TaxID=106335 RepID=A0A6A2Y6C3_HIBSY|nr:uncharacterized protein LOC120183280 isoform X2 [Hibiscus syriacus]KAE8664624.1 ZIP metal ion transporter family isoform 1 [Hibiscus syriacus]